MNAAVKTVVANVAWGVTYGLGSAGVFSLVAAVLYAVGDGRGAAGSEITLTRVIAFYLSAGLVCGVVAGITRPQLHAPVVRHAVTYLLSVAVLGGIVASVQGSITSWGFGEWVFVIAGSAVAAWSVRDTDK